MRPTTRSPTSSRRERRTWRARWAWPRRSTTSRPSVRSASPSPSRPPPRRGRPSTFITGPTTWTCWPGRSSRREPCLDTSLPEPKLSTLYQELILDHYRRPRNKGSLEGPTHAVSLNNPLCGDEIDLQLRVDGDVRSE